MNAKTLRVVGYGRVSKMGSRKIDDDATRTLRVQRAEVEAKAKAEGWTMAAWLEDVNASGGNTDRANFQKALAMIDAGEADVFAVAYLDRFSRSLEDTVSQERRIREAGGSLVVTAQKIDTTTVMGRGFFQMAAVMNEIFLGQKTEQFAHNRSEAVARGVSPTRTPLGYRKGVDRRYEIVEEEAEIVRLAFTMRAEGAHCTAIANALNDRGYRTRRGASYTDRLVYSMLGVASYCGDLVDGDLVHREAHPAIVSREVFAKARTVTKPRAMDATPGLLVGVVRCASCSYALILQGRKGTDALYYRCRGNHSSGPCPAPVSVKVGLLDSYVEAEFLRTADAHLEVGFDAAGDADVEAEIEASETELEVFLDGASIAALGADRYNREVAKRTARLDAALDARRRSQRSALPHVGYREVSEIWPTLEVAEKREVLNDALDAVMVKPGHASTVSADRVHIAPVGSVTAPLPRRGLLASVTPFEFPGDGAVDAVGMLAA